jgi:hypothetical protein
MKLRLVLAFLLTTITLIGVGWYWRSRQIQVPSQPWAGEKKFEVVENSDGRDVLIAYRYGFKVTIPKGWYFSSKGNYFGEVFLERQDGAFIIIRKLKMGNRGEFPTFRDYVVNHTTGDVPDESNLTIAGYSAFEYRESGPHIQSVVVVMFETPTAVYEISVPVEYKDESGYRTILDSFELLE